MVQELHVLKCFSCETFQSHIVKKTNKWDCKVCGTRQSIKKVYGRGSGKDCRIHTQRLNNLRGEKEDREQVTERNNEESDGGLSLPRYLHRSSQSLTPEVTLNEVPTNLQTESKWKEFMDDGDNATDRKRNYTTEAVSLAPGKCQSNFRKRERNVHINEDDLIKKQYQSQTCESVNDIYSDFSTCDSKTYFNKIKRSKYPEKNFKENKYLKVSCVNDFTNNYEIEQPVSKFRKLSNKCSPEKVSLKWSKYLEPDVTHSETELCYKNDSKSQLCQVDDSVPVSFHCGDNSDIIGRRCVFYEIKEQNMDIHPEHYLKKDQFKDQSLPVFEQCDLNDVDFQIDF